MYHNVRVLSDATFAQELKPISKSSFYIIYILTQQDSWSLSFIAERSPLCVVAAFVVAIVPQIPG